jgi:hypothetical protein
MAKDFHSVCERDFPAKEIGQFLSRHVSSEEEAHQRRTMLHYVRQVKTLIFQPQTQKQSNKFGQNAFISQMGSDQWKEAELSIPRVCSTMHSSRSSRDNSSKRRFGFNLPIERSSFSLRVSFIELDRS